MNFNQNLSQDNNKKAVISSANHCRHERRMSFLWLHNSFNYPHVWKQRSYASYTIIKCWIRVHMILQFWSTRRITMQLSNNTMIPLIPRRFNYTPRNETMQFVFLSACITGTFSCIVFLLLACFVNETMLYPGWWNFMLKLRRRYSVEATLCNSSLMREKGYWVYYTRQTRCYWLIKITAVYVCTLIHSLNNN